MSTARIFQALTYWPTYLLLKLFFRYKVNGRENLEGLANRSVVFAANHNSFIDGPICAAAVPQSFFPIRFLVLDRFFRWRYLFAALYVRVNGSIPVHKHTGKSLDEILASAIRALKNGAHLWIFPEGKMSRNGQLQPGKRGVAFLHQRTGAPIVPVAIKGAQNLLSLGTLLWKHQITINIGKPIYSLKSEDYREGAAEVMEVIAELLGKKESNKNV